MRPTPILTCLLWSVSASAADIYRWVDENGTVNFSQTAPPNGTQGVRLQTLDESLPASYDPEEDIYQLQAQAERMQALREEMAKRREARREREQSAASLQTTPYRPPYPYARPLWWHPPLYPKPPVRPQPPVPEPYETRILVPPGSRPD